MSPAMPWFGASSHLRLLLGLGTVTVVPMLAAIVALMFGIDIAGMNPAPFAVALGLIGMGWLIGTSQMLDGTIASDIRADALAETRTLTACAVEMQRANAVLQETLAATRARLDLLSVERDDLAVQLTLDPLTGARNRRAIGADFDINGTGTVLALLDIDHFKTINDTLGHDVGDRVLKHFVRLLRARLGEALPVYRVGGEEFVIMFPEGRMDEVAALLDGVRADLRADPLTRMGDPVTLSFSAGLALCTHVAQGFDDVFKMADERLYDAKTQGRARTMWQAVSGV